MVDSTYYYWTKINSWNGVGGYLESPIKYGILTVRKTNLSITPMLESSREILLIVLAFCAAILTFFICWALYYIVMMLKRARAVTDEVSDVVRLVKEKIERLGNLLDAVEEKLKNTAGYLPLVLKGVTDLVGYFKRRHEDKAKRSKTNGNK